MTAGGILRTQGKCEGTDGRNARDTKEEDDGNGSDVIVLSPEGKVRLKRQEKKGKSK